MHLTSPPKQLAPKGAAPEQTQLCQKAKPRNPETKTPARAYGHQNTHLPEHPKPLPSNSVPTQRKTLRLSLKLNLKTKKQEPPSPHPPPPHKPHDAAPPTTIPPSPRSTPATFSASTPNPPPTPTRKMITCATLSPNSREKSPNCAMPLPQA